ncbi:MAG: LrgB family protein [Oscillospiraceae bacterium]|jgi:predicted murein hydrolase (TIGR00659 family)|nr:LrgB family protein [Oscillospiraceae bacterium]
MSEVFQSCACFGLLLAMGSFQLARAINKRVGKEVCNPLLFATLLCGAVLLGTGTEYDVFYDNGGNILEFFLTPATICLAIPLYKQFELLKKNAGAVLAGCAAGVAAHMAGCALMLVLFRMEAAEYISLLPKSITTAIGKGLSQELGGFPAITMATIMLTGLFGAVAAPALLRLFRVTEPVSQGLAIGTSSHAAGTSRAVEMGEVQGAASSLAIVVTGLLTVIAAPLMARLV